MSGIYSEIGRLGLNRRGKGFGGGIMYEEFVRDLQGRKGVETYREMSENDDMVGSVLFAIEMLLRQVKWNVCEAGGGGADIRAAEFVMSCMGDMDETWTDFISEALSFLVYGWSYHEIVYKRRMGSTRRAETDSKYNDGLIGWRKLPIRSQDTLYEWIYDGHDNLEGMVQCAPPDYERALIPIEKALHFRTKSRKGSPEGRSILRSAYRAWYMKKRIQEIEGIGIERDLAGLPILQPPEGVDLFADDPDMKRLLSEAERIVRGVRRDEREGIVLPHGWTFSLMSTGGRRQFDTGAVIERYDLRIAMTVLADFVMMGHEAVGSFALSSDKTELFAVAMGTFLDIICEVFNNQAIPRLIALNAGAFGGIAGCPELRYADLESRRLADLSAYIKDLVGAGALTPDDDLEDYLRMQAELPERGAAASYMGAAASRPAHEPRQEIADAGGGEGAQGL